MNSTRIITNFGMVLPCLFFVMSKISGFITAQALVSQGVHFLGGSPLFLHPMHDQSKIAIAIAVPHVAVIVVNRQGVRGNGGAVSEDNALSQFMRCNHVIV